MRYYPTEEWLEEYGRLLDESNAFDRVAGNWGVDFNGDVLYVIEDVPLTETTLADLPDPVLEDIPAPLRAGIGDVNLEEAPDYFDDDIRESLPAVAANLLDQLEDNVHDATLYAYIGLEAGNCTEVDLVDGIDARDVGFVIRGNYHTWKQIIDGRPPGSALVRGDLSIDGNWVRTVQYGAVLNLLGEIAAKVDTVHLFDGDRQTADRALVDGAMRGPLRVHREVQQQASWVTETLSLF